MKRTSIPLPGKHAINYTQMESNEKHPVIRPTRLLPSLCPSTITMHHCIQRSGRWVYLRFGANTPLTRWEGQIEHLYEPYKSTVYRIQMPPFCQDPYSTQPNTTGDFPTQKLPSMKNIIHHESLVHIPYISVCYTYKIRPTEQLNPGGRGDVWKPVSLHSSKAAPSCQVSAYSGY